MYIYIYIYIHTHTYTPKLVKADLQVNYFTYYLIFFPWNFGEQNIVQSNRLFLLLLNCMVQRGLGEFGFDIFVRVLTWNYCFGSVLIEWKPCSQRMDPFICQWYMMGGSFVVSKYYFGFVF